MKVGLEGPTWSVLDSGISSRPNTRPGLLADGDFMSESEATRVLRVFNGIYEFSGTVLRGKAL